MMLEKSTAQKMRIQPGAIVVFIDTPEDYPGALGPLPDPITVQYEPSLSADVTLVFVDSKSDMDTQLSRLTPCVREGAVLWVAFRKGTAKPKPDFNRDDVLRSARAAGFHNLTLISLDADWAAFKFKAI
ncbi:MAG: hypothetical protein JWN14_3547 [Chthonomonadales bacterium]|nr:hypothetical protein [Chthonomonadales bacterium]